MGKRPSKTPSKQARSASGSKSKPLIIAGERVRLGETKDIALPLSETYATEVLSTPVRVIRAKKDGPRVLVTGVVHGDELNGVGIIRQLMFDESILRLKAGALVCAPVVNMPAFESQSRNVPDRRDLNRSFPGSANGSMASRIAHVVFTELVKKVDYCIDLHTAAIQRTNYPNIRVDLRNAKAKRIAKAFGCALLVDGRGPEGSLRRCACDAGVPTIVLEAGEVWKIEPDVVEVGVRGVRNVLIKLGMLDDEPMLPAYQTTVAETTWLRAQLGGLLWFHVAPGALVEAGQAIATNASLFGEGRAVLISPVDGIILGMTTLPAVRPGEPVCHIAQPNQSLASIRRAIANAEGHLHLQLQRRLAGNLHITNHDV